MKPWEVQRFEGIRPIRRPAEIMGGHWHGEAAQRTLGPQCEECHRNMIAGMPPLWLGKFCGSCALALGLIPPEAA